MGNRNVGKGLSGALQNVFASYHIYLLLLLAGLLVSVSSAETGGENLGETGDEGPQMVTTQCTPSPCISPSPSASPDPYYYMACVDLTCAQLQGTGNEPSTCSTSEDCIITSPTPEPYYYWTCVDLTCAQLQGTGNEPSTCETNDDCVISSPTPTPYHMVCRDQQCIQIEGEGQWECEVDANCIIPSPSPTPQCTVPPDECSTENQEACGEKIVGDICYYGGGCNTDSCSCEYEMDAYCPIPGTIYQGLCYYGEQACTPNGCGEEYSNIYCRDGVMYDTCDPSDGPIDTLGPVVVSVNAIPDPANFRLNIHANVSEDCSPIHYAEFYFDYCDEPGTGTGIYPTDDGQFNNDKFWEIIAARNVILQNFGIGDGRHTVYVRAQNENGEWGECNYDTFEVDQIPPEVVRNITIPYWVCAGNPQLTAEICDSQSPVVQAEYFLDGTWNSWPNGQGYQMGPMDGGWDELCEWVNATFNSSLHEEGRHCVKLHGKDLAGNWGKMSFQQEVCFVIDRTPPQTTKTIGEPRIACDYLGEEQEAANCYYVTQDTEISFTSVDPDPGDGYFSDQQKVYYRHRWKEDFEDGWGSWSGWILYTQPFSFSEDSIHEIEYYSIDFCNNEERHWFEIDIVDTAAPVSEKTLGEPKAPCEAGDGCDYFITQQTPITLTCNDQEPHPSDAITIKYRYKLDDEEFTDWITYSGTFTYEEDSRHELEWYCVDALGNVEQTHSEVEKVDSQPPIVEKTVGDPKVECQPLDEGIYECDYYVTQDTEFTLTATDFGHAANKPIKIFYKICSRPDYLVDPETCTGWIEYSGPFSYEEDSYHTLTYFAVDYVGNMGRHMLEADFVDSQPPLVEKMVGKPQVKCEPDDSLGCDYYMTTDTQITLECEDAYPHPVAGEQIFFRYKINDGDFPDEWTEYEGPFSYPEDSMHTLEYYCTDALGNEGDIMTEIDVVDSQPPETQKTVGDPKHECETGEECDWYITQQTPITMSCIDQDPHPVGGEQLLYKYLVDDGEWTDLMLYEGPFTFPEDSMHTLKYYCVDALGNEEEEHTEIDIVETVPPVVRKVVGEPKVPCVDKNGCDFYVTSQTPITLYCTDPNPHPSNHVSISYRIRYRLDENSEWGEWGDFVVTEDDEVTFTLPEDSMHEIEYYCKDILGNTALTQTELDIVDNQGPTVAKTVGDPKVACGIGEGCDWYITQSTPISFEATDPLPHPVDAVKIYYRYNVNDGDWSNWALFENDLYFAEDSKHTIEYYAEDALGNKGPTYSEIDYIETVPPVTTKTVGDPKVECDQDEQCDYYITQQTTITLAAIDPEPHPVDRVRTYYWYCVGEEPGDEQIELVTDYWCTNETEYTGPFTFPEDSRHTLYYYSVDALGNQERTQMEIDIVETQPPVISKVVGKPSISCEDLGRDDCHYFITQNTDITLECTDPYPHPVDRVSILYRYNVDGGQWEEWVVVEGTSATINFKEDSVHTIEYYCEDALGNRANLTTEIDRVDTTPPETEKIIMGNKTACGPEEECDYYVCRDTLIGFSALDGGPICHVDGTITYYRYQINGGGWSDWIEYEPGMEFAFSIEGEYEIEYYSQDQLFNEEGMQSEIDIFDKQPPKGWVLNPTSGRWYHDGEKFSVYAPAMDKGDPASGFTSCMFYAMDVHFEELTETELQAVMLLMRKPYLFDNLLEYLGPERYHLVSLGSVPFDDGVCKGSVQIPEESGLTDKAYLVIEINDRSCNTYYDLARDTMGDVILMDIDNQAPFIELDHTEGLDEPLSTGDYFAAYLKAEDHDSALFQCSGEITQETCNDDECIEQTFSFAGQIIDDSNCKVFGNAPIGLNDGSHTLALFAMDMEYNKANVSATMMVDNSPPEKEITSPQSGETYGQIIPIEMMAQDASGIREDTVQYRIFEDLGSLFGVPIGPEKYDSGWRVLPYKVDDLYGEDFNTTAEGLEDGKTYYMRARACDNLFEGDLPDGAEIPAHCSDPQIEIKIDLRAPEMGAVTISNGILSWPAATDANGVDHYNVYLDGVLVDSTSSNAYDTAGQTGNWAVTAVDTVGNEGSSISATAPTPISPATTSGSSGSSGGSSYYMPQSVPEAPASEETKSTPATKAQNVEAVKPKQYVPVEPEKPVQMPRLTTSETVPLPQATALPEVNPATGLFAASVLPWEYGLAFIAALVALVVIGKRRQIRRKGL